MGSTCRPGRVEDMRGSKTSVSCVTTVSMRMPSSACHAKCGKLAEMDLRDETRRRPGEQSCFATPQGKRGCGFPAWESCIVSVCYLFSCAWARSQNDVGFNAQHFLHFNLHLQGSRVLAVLIRREPFWRSGNTQTLTTTQATKDTFTLDQSTLFHLPTTASLEV